jgi:hypothetical protein
MENLFKTLKGHRLHALAQQVFHSHLAERALLTLKRSRSSFSNHPRIVTRDHPNAV